MPKIDISENKKGQTVVRADMTPEPVVVDLDKNIKMSMEELELRAEEIKANAKEIDKTLEGLSPEEKKAVLESTFADLGLDAQAVDEIMKSDWTPSDIIEGGATYVVEQEIQKTFASYSPEITSLVDWKMRDNGAIEFFYQDYKMPDNKAGEDDMEIGDLNNGHNPITYEWTRAYYDLHKGYDILDTVLNDITKTTGMFVSLLNDLALNVARPLARAMFQFTCQLIANPFIPKFDMAPLDVSTIDADIPITASNFKDAIQKINSVVGKQSKLYYTSRKHTTNPAWRPTKFTTNLEITPSWENTRILIDSDIDYAISNQVGSSTYQLQELKKGLTWTPLSFERTFEEIGEVTGLNRTESKFDLIVIYGRPVEGIVMYNATKVLDTSRLKHATNTYLKLGHAINKRYFILKLTVTITPPAEGESVQTNNMSLADIQEVFANQELRFRERIEELENQIKTLQEKAEATPEPEAEATPEPEAEATTE